MKQDVDLRFAAPADWAAIEGILREAALPIPAALPPVEFVVATRGGAVVACTGWEAYGERALLRSVAVREADRGTGTGRAVVERALAELAARGVREATLVTLAAGGFFARHGFQAIPRDEVSSPVQASPEFAAHCCGMGTWMRATLRAAAPPVPRGRIITLVYRVAPEHREALLAFFKGAFPFYERHGGTRMALYESLAEPNVFLELVAYATEADWAADQERVEHDPETRAKLAEWRAFLTGPVEFRQYGWIEP